MSSTADTVSPLAQAYNATGSVHTVEENPVEDETPGPQPSVSPIALRRLNHKKGPSSSQLLPPSMKTFASSHSPPKVTHGPKKVTQLESESELIMTGSDSQLTLEIERRLVRLEESQGRIEALLTILASRRAEA